jgi:phosphoribosylglycinamide formyltransferase 2
MTTPRIFGTPLSTSSTRVMLLGSGELGKEVIISLQRLGVEVIAVDRYPNAPGHQVAHRAHVIDMTDGAALKALIAQERPDLVDPRDRGDRHRRPWPNWKRPARSPASRPRAPPC